MTIEFRVVIPARYASSRLPGKPLVELAGKPMLQHVWERARESGAQQVVVATDDERIAAAATAFGADICMTSADHASGTDRIAEVVRQRGWADDDIVLNLQGDEPLTPPGVLAQAAEDLAVWPSASVATLATPLRPPARADDPNLVKVVLDLDGFALYFSRAPIPHWREGRPADDPLIRRHIGIYAYRGGFLHKYGHLAPAPLEGAEQLEQLRVLAHGYRIHVSDVDWLPAGGVDVHDDIPAVEAALRQWRGPAG